MAGEGDAERLIVLLEARIRDFEKNLEKASGAADRNYKRMRDGSRSAMQQIEADANRAAARITQAFRRIGSIPGNFILGVFQGMGQELFNQLAPVKAIQSIVALNRELAELGETAKRVKLSTDRLQEIKFGANATGLSDKTFLEGMERFATLLDDATKRETDLGRLFTANNIQLKDRQGRVLDTNAALTKAAELVRRAKTEQDKIKIAELLGLSKEWVKMLEGGAAGFNASAQAARNAGVIIDESTIKKAQEFDREWSQATARWAARFKKGAADILPDLNAIINKAFDAIETLDAKAKAANIEGKLAQGLPLTIKELAYAIELARSKGSPVDPSWIAQLEQMKRAALEASAALKPGAEAPAKKNEPSTVVPPPTAAGKTDYERLIQRTRDHIAVKREENDVLRSQNPLFEDFGYALSKARIQRELLNAAEKTAKENRTTVTPEQIASIEQLATSYANAEAETRRLTQAQSLIRERAEELRSTSRDVMGGIITDLRNGTNGAEIFANALNKIADRLQNMALDQLFGTGKSGGLLSQLFGFAFGGGGGGLGGLAGGLAGFAHGGVFNRGTLIPFATGGIVTRPTIFPFANGTGLMGEAGPEAIMPLRRDSSGRLGVSAPGGAAAPVLNQNVVINNHSNAEIEQRTDDEGNIEIFVGAKVRQELGSNRTNGIFRQKYGTNPTVKTRS